MNDEDLNRRLQAGDPARTLPPLTTARIRALTEHAMTTDPTTRPAPREKKAAAPRRLILGAGLSLVAAAAAAAIVVPILAGPAAAPVALRLPAGTSGLATACAPVSADFVGQAEIAFRGEVTGIRDGVVTLHVLHPYTGGIGDTVTVLQGDGSQVDGAAPVFAAGGDYLIAATGRTVLSCGSSGTDTPALRKIYDSAFTG